jgi:hypothetical protein
MLLHLYSLIYCLLSVNYTQNLAVDLISEVHTKYCFFNIQDLWQGIDFSRSKAEARVDVSFLRSLFFTFFPNLLDFWITFFKYPFFE